jgi:hypothetical protein
MKQKLAQFEAANNKIFANLLTAMRPLLTATQGDN